jgi:hypothetical protein
MSDEFVLNDGLSKFFDKLGNIIEGVGVIIFLIFLGIPFILLLGLAVFLKEIKSGLIKKMMLLM